MKQNRFAQRQSSLDQFWNWRLDLFEKCDQDKVRDLAQEIIDKEIENEDDYSVNGIIARKIVKTTWESFCRFGDRNCASGGLRLLWIGSKNGTPLDVQAAYITEETSIEITPVDMAQFIMEFEHGKSYFPPYLEYEELKKAFQNVVGFKWNYKFAKQIILKKQMEPGFF